ncbi:MAG: TolC family protein [Candidatus Aminicenantes bacterium]|nr:TolC family protein [Candidatus Aminicenantes bacterium]
MSKKTIALCLGLAVLAAAGLPARGQDAAGVLKLTLNDCIVRALQNNISLQVAVLGPESASLSLVRSREKYLPTLSFNYQKRDSQSASYSFLDVAGTSNITKTDNYGGSVRQSNPWGGTLTLSMTNGLTDTTQKGNTINPRYSTSIQLSLSQPLLRDFGAKMANRDILIARNSLDSSEFQLSKTVQDTIYGVTQAYWNLVYGIENMKVQMSSLQLAKDFLATNERKVEIGQMAPLDVYSAQAQVANIEATIISAESALKAYEDNLRLLLNYSPEEEAGIKSLVPVDQPEFTAHPVDLAQALTIAMQKRPDLRMSKIDMKTQELNLAYAKNQLLPSLSLSAGYSGAGVSGTQLIYDGNPLFGVVIGQIKGGFSDAFKDTLALKYPNWNIGLTLDISLSNFITKANYGLAQLTMKTAVLNQQNLEKTAVNEVRSAVRLMQTSYKLVQANQVARDLAEKKLAAEAEKLRVGLSTNYIVLQYQRDLGTARSAELQAIINYNVAQTGLDRAMGTLLENKAIKISDIPVK